MTSATIQARFRQSLLKRHWPLRWLSEAPLPVQAADERMRLTFFFRQLPLCFLLVLVFIAGLLWGINNATAPLGLVFLVFACTVLMWPVAIFRLGQAAHDCACQTEGKLRRRLQALWLFSLFYACLVFVLLVAMGVGAVWLTVLVG